MSIAQLTYTGSLRDFVYCLHAMREKLYHVCIRAKVSRTTLARTHEIADWGICYDFAKILIHQARRCYANNEFGLELNETLYVLDSTTIDLCLSLFIWALFRKTNGAIKMLMLLGLCDHTISDRIAQTVVKLALEPQVEPHFHDDSYGYRPGKSAHHALASHLQASLVARLCAEV
jgi:uncharacterized protein DUF4372